MYNRLAIVVAALVLAATTAAFAQTPTDVTGRVVRVDPAAQVIILDDNQAFRVTPNTVVLVGDRPTPIGALQPGQPVVIHSGEAVAITPAGGALAQAPPGTVVVAQRANSQTVFGRVKDVSRGEIKIEVDSDDFEVKVPREVAAQVRKGDVVRLDLTFNPTR
jgi:hypothetical protein